MSTAISASPSPPEVPTPIVEPTSDHKAEIAAWKRIVAEYQVPSALRATWQLINTLGGYVAVWFLIAWSLTVSWWLTIPLAVLQGGLLVRVFIIFHDCGHGSFFKSRLANDIFGFVAGMLTFTPYYQWRWEHSLHHATAGNLERRGVGDVWTLTVQEYLEASRWKRFAYHMARNPIILFFLAPVFLFVVLQRIPTIKAGPREASSVWWMNLALVVQAVLMSLWIGFMPYLVVQLIAMAVAGTSGVWLFYVQHQFEDAYWERDDWDYTAAALKGSSFYKLPRVLQWFSGNIGFHHIHHLSPRIPNYNLERCHRSDPMFQEVEHVTLWESLRLSKLRLWDEPAKKLIGFRHFKQQQRDARKAKKDAPN